MNESNAVRELVVRPASVNGAATCYVIDTADYDYAEFEIDIGAGATAAAFTTLKVQESDVEASATSLTSGTDVPGTIFGTSNTIAAPSNAPALPAARPWRPRASTRRRSSIRCRSCPTQTTRSP